MRYEKFTLKNYKNLILQNPHNKDVINQIPKENLVNILLKLPHEVFKEVLYILPYKKLAEAIALETSNKAKHIIHRINNIDTSLQKRIYTLLPEDLKHKIKLLLKYNDTQVGAYMHLEYLCASLDETISDIKTKIINFDKLDTYAPFIQLFICNKKEHLLGTINISKLIPYNENVNIKELLQNNKLNQPIYINHHAPIDKAIELFELFNLSSLAVVDKNGKLLGRILSDDIYTFIRVQEEKQVLNMLGTHHQAEKSFFTAQPKRLEWIFINLCAILLSALVVNYFKGTIQQIVTLAVLMPIVAALGGNVGNQAVTITVRRLAIGDISSQRAVQLILKEFAIGVVNGLIVGAFVGIITYLWFHQYMLGVVVGAAIILNLSLAGLIGSFLPIFFKRFNIDPAIASPLLLTTATDTMGFFIFLGLAKIILL
ncbi:magnesium transporter [Sulfurimonas sp.]